MSSAEGSDADLAELQQRLVTFSEQLMSIHELLEADPENSEFLTIAQDLVEVIRLTKEMIDLKLSSAGAAASTASAVVPAHSAAADGEFSPGTVCEALSKGVWFPAFIESLTARDTYNVHYIGFGNKDELPAASLRALSPVADGSNGDSLPPRSAIAVGFKCQAKYYVDAQYYTAEVTAVTQYGFQVLFDGYGNSEEVPYEYLRPLAGATVSAPTTDDLPAATDSSEAATTSLSHKPVAVTAAVQAAAARAAAAAAAASTAAALQPRDAVVAKAIKVPENLQILPTDSEAEKERKRKRFKHIQKLNKQIEADNTHTIKQHDWKSFQHKATKGGKVKGSGVLSKRGTSMFASPDSVQGRVGVVGSGQGMTQYEAAPKKIKKSHLESAPRL